MLLTLSWVVPLAAAILLLLIPNGDGSRDRAIKMLAIDKSTIDQLVKLGL